MKGHAVGWAFVDDRPHSTSLAVHAILPFDLRLARGTSGSGLLTTRTDFTARAVSLDTSVPSETAAQTPPSFKSKESAQKKRLNST